MNGKIMRYAGTVVIVTFIAVGAYLIGYKTAYDRMERAAVSYETETFYAAITGHFRQLHNGSGHGDQ